MGKGGPVTMASQAAIRQAAAEGRSLRRIGSAAGLSHERIRKIVDARRDAAGGA